MIRVVQGDITALKVDAIVNAANSTLLGGGAVDGAIHRAAGPKLKAYCAKLGGCPTGESKITPVSGSREVRHSHRRPCLARRKINEPTLLANCYRQLARTRAQEVM